MTNKKVVKCDDLERSIAELEVQGFRLDMIFPADSPSMAVMSDGDSTVKLVSDGASKSHDIGSDPATWVKGRAGMEYRDLLPGRLRGWIIASNIRLTNAGPVPDYVHYHRIDLQIIYCTRGRIKVVYEDQGDPFWLEAGDCVLQPPEIRHRVLECTAGAEVIEVTSPAEHVTWRDHDLELPNSTIDRSRDFGGQRFVRSRASEAVFLTDDDGMEFRDLGIVDATGGRVSARVVRSKGSASGVGKLAFPVSEDEVLEIKLPVTSA